jgi:hypothetical protein
LRTNINEGDAGCNAADDLCKQVDPQRRPGEYAHLDALTATAGLNAPPEIVSTAAGLA